MLIHLLLLLLQRNGAQAGSERRRANGHVTIECPLCQALGVAPQFTIERATGNGLGIAWETQSESYQCQACGRLLNAEAFKNDGSGVLKVKTWDCPYCHTDNIALYYRCQSCGESLV